MRKFAWNMVALVAISTGLALAGETKTDVKTEGKVTWRAIGPGAYGANFAVGFHPKNPKIMLAGTDMGALYRTEDAGKTWAFVGGQGKDNAQPGLHGAWNVVFDPKNGDTVWAASACAVCKSLDAGKTWKRMTDAIGGGVGFAIMPIGIDPTDTKIVYIGQGWVPRGSLPWAYGRIWKTVDGGDTWTELPRPGGPLAEDKNKSRNYTGIVVDPNSPFEKGRGHARLYVHGRGGFWVSNDAGQTWESLVEKLPAPTQAASAPIVCSLLVVTDKGKPILFAGVLLKTLDKASGTWAGGIYRSDDDGRTWITTHEGLEKQFSVIASYAGDHVRPVMLANSPAAPATLFAGCISGVFRSEDLGKTWKCLTRYDREWFKTTDWDGSERYYELRRHGGNFKDSICGGTQAFHELAVAASDVNFVAYNDNTGLVLTRDGGKFWEDTLIEYGEAFDPGRFGDRPATYFTHRMKSRGAQCIVPYDAAVDPFDPKTIFVGYEDIGLRISRDNGESWEYPTKYILARAKGCGVAHAVLFDPAVRNKAWVSFGWEGRLYVTEDGGKTFRQTGIEQLMREGERQSETTKKTVRFMIWQLAMDPKSPPEKRTLYAATSFGVYKSVDGGATWNDSSLDLDPGSDISFVVVNPKTTETLYAGSGNDGSIRSDRSRSGLYRSKDAGMNWAQLAPDKIGPVGGISLCKSAPETLYVVSFSPGGPAGWWAKSKLWKTTDGGETWALLREGECGRAIGVHPLNPDIVYYGFYTDDLNKGSIGFVRSRDGGKTWEDVAADIPLTRPRRVCFDDADPSRFFLVENFTLYEGRDAQPTAKKP